MRLALLLLAATVMPGHAPNYLPDEQGQKILSVQKDGKPELTQIVLTERVAVNETGPRQTVKKFGEVYAFSPTFFAVPREKAVEISFWNLQPDDEHDVLILAPDQTALMHWNLPPLTKTPFTYTFHLPGVYTIVCAMHRPEMTAQILVLP